MKIFSWMRSKRYGANQANNNPSPQPKSYHDHMMHQSCKEEFSDWPNGLLAIGTFGNNNLKHSDKLQDEDDQDKTTTTAQDLEEVDRELRLLLNNDHISVDSSFSGENENENLSVDQLLDRLRDGDAGLKRNSSSVVERGRKDMKSDKRKRGIGKKSLCFLMKKILLCGGGFVAPPPIIRDPLPDPKLDHSTMEKILRAMVHKKIYPQRPTPKKYLEMGKRESEDEQDQEACNHTSKWDKTDSEYIVLEI